MPRDLFVFDEPTLTLSAIELKSGETAWRNVASYEDTIHGEICTFSAAATKDTIYVLIWRKRFFAISPYSENPTWRRLEDFKDGHGPCPPVASIGDTIYVCGGGWKETEFCNVDGWETGDFNAACEMYDPERGWSYFANLSTPRRLNSVVNASGTLYCIGGLREYSEQDNPDWGKGKVLDLVEKYDAAANEWKVVAPMKTKRVAPAVTAYNNTIFVLGGGYGHGWLRSVERYDINSNVWTALKQEMIEERIKFTGFATKRHIYAIGGGRYGSTAEKVLEPDDVEEEGKWSEIENLLANMDINAMGTVVMKRSSSTLDQ